MAKNKSSTTSSQNKTSATSGLVALFGHGGSLEWVKSLAIAIGLALIIRWLFAEPFKIPSQSMNPTLQGEDKRFSDDRVFVNKLIYGTRFPLNECRIPFLGKRIEYAKQRLWNWKAPQRWDIIVFKAVNPEAEHPTLVKRIVGLPGERIHIEGGKIYVNGIPLELPPSMPKVYYTSQGTYGVLTDDLHAVIPENHYLVLGDNSAHSADGRYFGWLPGEHILGRVSCIWWPISRWRDFTGFSQTLWWNMLVASLGLLTILRIFFGRSWAMAVPAPNDAINVNHLYINRWAFGIPIPFTRFHLMKGRFPKRGELVLYHSPTKANGAPDLLLGRVAGLPGERVSFDKNHLQIDGVTIQEPSLLAQREFLASNDIGPYGKSKNKEYSMVPENHFFILAESAFPEEHWDSRTLGWVAHSSLVGKASLLWWPPTRWRRMR